MIESLFQGKSQKTTREREAERRAEARFARASKLNGWLRYKPQEMLSKEGKSGGTA